MVRIGDFSKICQVTVKALRHYDLIGLLKPVFVDQDNGYRYYSPDQLNTIHRIVNLKELDFSLATIKRIINGDFTDEELRQLIQDKIGETKMTIEAQQSKLIKLELFRSNFKKEFIMSQVFIKSLPEIIVASMRVTIPTYNALHQVAPSMGAIMEKQGAVCSKPPYCFNIYHDGEYKETDIDVEICESVVDFCKDSDNVTYKTMPAIPSVACIQHKGPYENLSSSYAAILKWIEENKYEIVGLSRESFIDGCWNKENPEEWLTEIQFPISKKS